MKKTWLGILLLVWLVLAGCDTGSKSIVFLTNRTDLRNTLLKEAVEQFELEYQDSNWKEKTKKKIESIDFNVNNPIWREIGLFTNKPNKSIRNKIYKLFKEEVS